MKKGVLILLGMFMMVSTVEAKNGENLPDRFRVNYSYNNAVNFIERGIEFYIFTNGDFDFETRFNDRRLRINRNFRGQIRSIGNVFINYDFRGNVTRVGNVSIRYNRGRLTRVGDLRVRYDRWEAPVFYGNVRDFYYNDGIRFNISFGDVCNYNDAFFSHRDFGRNYTQFREDRNFFYYKARPNARIGKRSTILKRRKPASANRNNNRIVKRNADNSYRKSDRRADNNSQIKRSNRNSESSLRNNTKTKVKTERRTVNRNSGIKKETRNSNRTVRNSDRKSKVKTERKVTNKNTRIKKKVNTDRNRRG
jgi:hypothetical protein